jgi:hypothetical protein
MHLPAFARTYLVAANTNTPVRASTPSNSVKNCTNYKNVIQEITQFF